MIKINSTIEADRTEFDRAKPYFAVHKPDFKALDKLDRDFENLIVIGNGGSVTSFRALNHAFRDEHDKNVEIVTTMDPDYLRQVEKSVDPENTVIMPISKSGSTTGVIESTLYFLSRNYRVIPLTSKNDGALRKIAEKNELETVDHPDIGGRYTGLSETALAPAAMLGLHVREIFRGGREMHEKLSPKNPNKALKLAEILYEAEEQDFEEVLTPFYATRLFGFYPLLVQLMHESVCKKGEGQTFYGDLGPEYQHHTNQRMFGGQKNIIPMFVEATHEHETIKIPNNLRNIDLKDKQLEDFHGKTYEGALKAESEGVKQALNQEDMPFVELKLQEFNYGSIGAFMAFLQYLAVYSSWIRDVNAFNQPDVEKSKEIGFEKRFEK